MRHSHHTDHTEDDANMVVILPISSTRHSNGIVAKSINFVLLTIHFVPITFN